MSVLFAIVFVGARLVSLTHKQTKRIYHMTVASARSSPKWIVMHCDQPISDTYADLFAIPFAARKEVLWMSMGMKARVNARARARAKAISPHHSWCAVQLWTERIVEAYLDECFRELLEIATDNIQITRRGFLRRLCASIKSLRWLCIFLSWINKWKQREFYMLFLSDAY